MATGGTHVVNAGTISGGLASSNMDMPYADAIRFSGGGNALELHAGSTILGHVVSTSGATGGGDTLTFGSSDDTPVTSGGSADAGTFIGFAGFRKVGGGVWTLTGNGTLVAHGVVEAGTLLIGDATHTATSVTGDVRVSPGAALGGTGRVNGTVTVDIGGTLLPGLGLDALVIACDLSLQGGGMLVFAPATAGAPAALEHNAIQVEGRAALQGALAMDLASNAYRIGTSYEVVHAAQGIEGRFEGVALSPGYATYVTPVVAYGPSAVSVAFAPTAAAYDDRVPNYANTVSTALDATFQTILGDIDADPFESREDARSGVWAQGVGSEGSLGSSDQTIHGGAVGGGMAVSDNAVLGIAVAGANTRTDDVSTQVKARPLGAFGYGVFTSGAWRFAASLGGGHLKQTSTRRLADVGLSASADGTGRFLGAAARLDYRWTSDRFALTPFVQASYLDSRYDAADEQGTGMLDLRYGQLSQKQARYEGGLRLSALFGGDGTSVVPWLQVGVAGWAGDRRAGLDESIGGIVRRVQGAALPSSATTASAGVNLLHGAWRLGLSYRGTFGRGYRSHGGTVSAEYHW